MKIQVNFYINITFWNVWGGKVQCEEADPSSTLKPSLDRSKNKQNKNNIKMRLLVDVLLM